MTTFLCLASQFKGSPFLVEAARQGVRVFLLTRSGCEGEPWPGECLADLYHLPDLAVTNLPELVGYLERHERIDAIVPLHEGDVETAAHLREHFRLPGLGDSAVRFFRDKLAMRMRARDARVPVPAFVAAFNDEDVADFLRVNPGPWMLKPRSWAGGVGIRRCETPAELWTALDGLDADRSHYLIEQFIEGDVFHVDSVTSERRVCFAQPHRYDAPPWVVSSHGGVFGTRTVDTRDPVRTPLLALNAQILHHLGMVQGIGHAEFIRCQRSGRLLFLEVAARVGGANIDVLVEQTTGVNLWREWVRLELAALSEVRYLAPDRRAHHGALLQCLARQEWPDLSGFEAPEVVWRLKRRHHAGLIVASPSFELVDVLAETYRRQLEQNYLAVLPPRKAPCPA